MRNADIFAISRPPRVMVTCFGKEWELELHTAADWVGAIGFDMETLVGVMPGAIPDDRLQEMWPLSKRSDSSRRWLNAARVAVGRGSGRDWWWTMNMVRKCLPVWPYINGQLLLKGVDAATLPLPSWLDAAFMLLWGNQDEDGRTKLELELSVRPKGVEVTMSEPVKRKMLESFASD